MLIRLVVYVPDVKRLSIVNLLRKNSNTINFHKLSILIYLRSSFKSVYLYKFYNLKTFLSQELISKYTEAAFIPDLHCPVLGCLSRYAISQLTVINKYFLPIDRINLLQFSYVNCICKIHYIMKTTIQLPNTKTAYHASAEQIKALRNFEKFSFINDDEVLLKKLDGKKASEIIKRLKAGEEIELKG